MSASQNQSAPCTNSRDLTVADDRSPGERKACSSYAGSAQPTGKPAAVAWMVALGTVFLGTGLAGATRPVLEKGIAALTVSPSVAEVPVEEITMADLPGEPAPLESPEPANTSPAAPADTPPEPETAIEELEDVPPPAAIEEVIPLLESRPVRPSPAPERPRPQEPVPPRATKPAVMPAPAAAGPAATAGGRREAGGQGTGGAGGPGNGAGAGGKGKFPQPPYPAAARSRGLSGTVTLSISVAPTGDVTSVSVVGSSGSSELDGPAAAWVQRRWKWPPGGARQYRMPVTFRLR